MVCRPTLAVLAAARCWEELPCTRRYVQSRPRRPQTACDRVALAPTRATLCPSALSQPALPPALLLLPHMRASGFQASYTAGWQATSACQARAGGEVPQHAALAGGLLGRRGPAAAGRHSRHRPISCGCCLQAVASAGRAAIKEGARQINGLVTPGVFMWATTAACLRF